mmetsp:Transcript_23944/g.26211  ORF Transcript_23944/g.26211 Transcript_23944/m.26211 type:complete len:290 (-) Transcript_23944:70-939(-)|eukprot:gene11973-13067_t
MSKFGRKIKQAPAGYEDIEPTITALENELRERVNEPHEGLRKNEALWPVHQINWQKSRYVYDMYYTYNRISKEVYDYCINNKIIDAQLIAKWKKAGYERLCSTYVINPRNYKFGTVSICRVPKQFLAPGTAIEDPTTGCRGCASGNSHNIFGNKYGQYLAAIQIAREERAAKKAEERAAKEAAMKKVAAEEEESEDEDDESSDDDESSSDDDKDGPVTEADGRSKKAPSLWAKDETDEVELTEDMIGHLAPEARREAMTAASKAGLGESSKESADSSSGPPTKRVRTHK